MKKKINRLIGFLLSLILIFGLFPVTAFAGFSTVTNLPTSAGSTLSNGYIYRVNGNTTITASTGRNALNVASGATAVIYIPSGYTLTVNGGSGSATTGGGAGIYLPSNSTLIVTGGGRLLANGGSNGSASSGSGGTEPWRYGSDRGSYSGVTFYTGTGGNGGNGGGGAGAGIGGSGGGGGGGGSGGAPVYVGFKTDRSGKPGSNGGGGASGTSMGNLYVLGTVDVRASGGSYNGAQGYGGAGGYWAYGWYHGGWTTWQAFGAGGGGGGGARGGYASGIGGGAGGGGGGAGGGSGAAYWIGTWTTGYFHNGGGGGGGQGVAYGNPGTSVGNAYGYEGMSPIAIGSGATVYSYNGSGSSGGGVGYGSGYGGSGGSYGSGGRAGIIYKAPTATVNNYVSGSGYNSGGIASATNYSGVPNEISYSVTLDRQGGSGGSGDFNIGYGTHLPSVSIPAKSQYSFMGYYTSPNGYGTRYYDQRGAGLMTWENTSDVTLYAHWVQDQFNVTFDRQTGSGGTESIITTGTDGTLPTITKPTKQYFAFNGYYDKASGAGTKYYDADGTPVSGRKLTSNSVLYAFWTQNQFRISFHTQGGTGGTTSTVIPADGLLPAISMPTKTGYNCTGYWNQTSGGTQYYNASGTGVDGRTLTADTTLYAQWDVAQYSITYNLEGSSITGNPTTRRYTASTTIPNPTKTDYMFLGWQMDGGNARTKSLTIPGNTPAYAKNIALTAAWAKTMDTDVTIGGNVQVAAGNSAELKADLSKNFETMVSDPTKGVTTDDLSGDKSVTLMLSVDVSADQTGHGKIDDIAQGSSLKFYDITARKQIYDGVNTTTTTLVEIPSPILVKIPLTGDLAGKASYRVYRVHDGVAEELPVGPTSGEYYHVENGNIVISTRKFSTYGVVGSETQIESTPGENFMGGGSGVDVQGKIIETAPGLVYKIDVAWGAMKFEYSMDREWDPDIHMYTEGSLNAWRPAGFDGENNKIRSINHSNGPVKLNMAVTKNDLAGVDMSLHIFNEITAVKAENFVLPEAPLNSTDAELQPATAYLFLSGSPESNWLDNNKTAFSKVGVITVTVEPEVAP